MFLSWKGFRNGHTEDIWRTHKKAFEIAAYIHPHWNKLKDGAKRLHARNIHQVLGHDLKSPSKFLICWTQNGEPIGGTRTSIILAREIKIPVYNLGSWDFQEITPEQLVVRITV